MKFRMMLSALLLAAGLVFVIGWSEKSESGGGKSEKKVDTPTEVAKKAFDAMKKHDFDTLIAISDGKAQEEAKKAAKYFKQMKEMADKGDAQAKQMLEIMQKVYAEMTYEVKGEKIEGDFAEVEVAMTMGGETKTEKMHFKKVNGQWKGIADEDYKPAK